MVDDFSIACKLEETYTKLCDIVDKNWQVPMSRYGMMKHFNGIDVYQSGTHISISSKTNLDTVFKNYGWKDLTPTLLPIGPSNEFVRALDFSEPLAPSKRSRLDNTRFRYRAAIGELIWPMITTRQNCLDDVMLEKITGVSRSDKLMIIQLLEVDLNQVLWVAFARNITKLVK
jgi:hypothetical protein